MSATTVRFRKLITTDLANNAVNLSSATSMGHRVQIPMSVDDLNNFFVWYRPAGSHCAVGHFDPSGGGMSDFMTLLSASLSNMYTDVDGVTNGLNFSSSILDANTDPRIRVNGNISANDLVMAYLLYKCYGASSATTASVIYNLQDAQNMLTNAGLVMSIDNALMAEEALSSSPGVDKGGVDAMFRDLLAADPMRFFDAAGNQIAGIFETNAPGDSRGNWNFIENDKIELRVQFNFTNSITTTGIQDPSQALESAANQEDTSTVVIAAGSSFVIRLQILATDTPSASAAKRAAAANASAADLAADVAAAKKAAANAAAALDAAQQAVNSAAAQTKIAQDEYQENVREAAAQATAVANAMAAQQAAQTAFAGAVASGSSAANIQQQNAANTAAQAAVAKAQAIANQAAATLLTTKTASEVATQNLLQAQLAASNCAATLANAEAAITAAELAAAQGAAAAQAAAAAAATAASMPAAQATTSAAAKEVDPQTIVAAQAAANTATKARLAALTAFNTAAAQAAASTSALASATTDLANAISMGQSLENVQIARAKVVATTAQNVADISGATVLDVALLKAEDQELHAHTAAATLLAQQNAFIISMANADVNSKQNAVNQAAAANASAASINAAAQATAAAAQSTLNGVVAAGGTALSTQPEQLSLLNANTTAAQKKSALQVTTTALTQANIDLSGSLAVVATAAAKEANDASGNAAVISSIQAALSTAKAYQASVEAQAVINKKAADLNTANAALNRAQSAAVQAAGNYDIAQRALNTAVNSGATPASLAPLQNAAEAAAQVQTNANLLLVSAQNAFDAANAAVTQDPASAAIFQAAAAAQITAISNAQANTLVLRYNKSQAAAFSAQAAAAQAAAQALAAQNALNNAITGGMPLSQINSLRISSVNASAASATATAAMNQANAAAVVDLSGVNADPLAVAILTAMLGTQTSSITVAYTNQMTTLLINAYAADSKAKDNLLTAQLAQTIAESALADAQAQGTDISGIAMAQEVAAEAEKATSKAQHEANRAAAALAEAQTWATASPNSLIVVNAASSVAQTATQQAAAYSLSYAYMSTLNIQMKANIANYQIDVQYNAAANALQTAATAGAPLEQISTLQANVNKYRADITQAQLVADQANAAVSTSLGAVYINPRASTIVAEAFAAETASLDAAQSNAFVRTFLNANAAAQAAAAAFAKAEADATTASNAMNTAITAGATVQQIQGLLAADQAAQITLASAQATLDSTAAAAYNALLVAKADPLAITILLATYNDQVTAVQNAKANSLILAYRETQSNANTLNNTLTAAQAAYTNAQAALTAAITAGSDLTNIQGLRLASQAAGAALSSAQANSTAANAAMAQALASVLADPVAAAMIEA